MSTYTQIYYHLVFSTKYRKPVLDRAWREELYKYISGVIKNKKCHLYRIGGTDDHMHIFSDLHPSVPLAAFIKDIKISSNDWIKDKGHIPRFEGWQDGYGGFTENEAAKSGLIEYIKAQEEHHKKFDFMEELRKLLHRANLPFNERYF